MATYTIGEVAGRSGFSASALRYYEGIGLVRPSTRTEAGYRVYDETALARLGFIARAKQLGCSLEDVTDLVSIWEGERCGPVQRRFHALVTEKINDAQRQIAELTALTAQLQAAASQLAGPPIDGPCRDDCACLTTDRQGPSEASIACTLKVGLIPDRIAAWQAVLHQARSRTAPVPGTLRITFDDALPLEELARLVAAEQGCCAFFSFSITMDQRGIGLEVRAPEGTDEIVAALFGRAA